MDSRGIVKLNDYQIFKYYVLQTRDFFKKSPTIVFDIYRYGFSGIQSKYNLKKLDELVNDLSTNTKFMISLPFSLIFQIYKNGNQFTSRYEGEATPAHTRFLSKGINELLAYPDHTLEKMKINPKDYLIEKRKSPKRIYMNESKINPFPILLIKDKFSQEHIKDNLEKEVQSNKILSERFRLLEVEYQSDEDLKREVNSNQEHLILPTEEIPF